MTKGAVAAGHPLVVEAGLSAMRAGGTAVDAAISAMFTSCVAEPLLTGLLGGGIATIRMNGVVEVCDFFSRAPGCASKSTEALPMERVELDFGPTTQTFRVGGGSVAVPGMPNGIIAMHARYGRLPLERLVAPAVEAAHQGVMVTAGFARVNRLLWPILKRNPEIVSLFARDGQPLAEGDVFRCPELGDTLALFADEGLAAFTEGDLGQGLLDCLGAGSLLSREDLQESRARFLEPLEVPYRNATVWLAGPPSVGGMLVAKSIRHVERSAPLRDPLSAPSLGVLAEALREAERVLGPEFYRDMFGQGFVEQFSGSGSAGYTTHLSVVDESGNAVAVTSSLGETAGIVVPGTGLLANNFLGEEDVNPSGLPWKGGKRLVTMCCPTLLEHDGWVIAMGSGGSSRIRSAVLHGVIFLVDGEMPAAEAVRAPRVHVDSGVVRFEAESRANGVVEAVEARYPDAVRFEELGMYFGGLHLVGGRLGDFAGAGDPRRSGAFGKI